MKLKFKKISSEEFEYSKEDWTRLLRESDADPIFLSWEWQFSWWKTWWEDRSLALELYFVYSSQDLVAILPLFFDSDFSWPIQKTRLQFIGNQWRKSKTIRTEYLGPIVKNGDFRELVIAELAKYVFSSLEWKEFVFCDCEFSNDNLTSKIFFNLMNGLAGGKSLTLRSDVSYSIYSPEGFSSYTSSLSKNRRYKLINRRAKAESIGVKFKRDSKPAKGIDKFLEYLNDFHVSRIGEEVFPKNSHGFHKRLVKYSEAENSLVIELSSLVYEEKVISVLYNIQCDNKVYNLQAGFNETFVNNISLGTLHLGYCMENHIKSDSSTIFDLLAGSGKNTNYKEGLSNQQKQVVTSSFYRSNTIFVFSLLRRKIFNLRQAVKSLFLSH